MRKILVCDDDAVIMNVVCTKLKNENFGEITTAGDGKDAIDLASKNTFDLIITDLQMPFQSGLDLIRHVRKVLQIETPIIVLSSEGLENVVMEAFELGANDFITKPFSSKELVIRVKNILG